MKRKHLPFLWIMTFGLLFTTQVKANLAADTTALLKQDSINARSLIISEFGSDWRAYNEWAYVEFANTGETTLDLSRYFVWNPSWGDWNADLILAEGSENKLDLAGMLAPGETYVIVQREQNGGEDPYGERLYPNGYTNFEAERFANDIVKRWGKPLTDNTIEEKHIVERNLGLAYRNMIKEYKDSIYPDSVFIDRFGTSKIENDDQWDKHPIAGVSDNEVWRARYYVRKFHVKTGNTLSGEPNDYPISEWDESRGTDISDSEWLPLPRQMEREYSKIFTTIGHHGDNPEFQISSDIASIDLPNEKITIPYGVSRDSIFRLFETGVNHAWELKLGADTSQFFVQEDDSIFFYTVGNTLNIYKFGFEITKDNNTISFVAPKVYKNANGDYIRRFNISMGELPMDTIGTLPFDMPVDSFFAYMVKEPDAQWTIIPKDGTTRPEIKEGDILEVTAADGETKKKYYLGVENFFPNHDATLSSIYFPGLLNWTNPSTYDLTDTLIGFKPASLIYSIDLPAEISVSPPIVAQVSNSRSRVVVDRATNLRGSETERTAKITVTAEDDTTINVYKLIFNIDRETPKMDGTPFITDFATGWGATNQNYNYQFFNPSDDYLDLTDYVFIAYQNNNFDGTINGFNNDSNWVQNNKYILRFGSIIEPDVNNVPVYKIDLVQSKVLLEPKEVYSMATRGAWPVNTTNFTLTDASIDLIMGRSEKSDFSSWWSNNWKRYAEYKYGSTDPWKSEYMLLNGIGGSSSLRNWDKSWGTVFFGLAKILNDSVKDGTKHVTADFYKDYEWVDHFGGPSRTLSEPLLFFENDTFINAGSGYTTGLDMGVYRKSNVYTGNPVESLSFGRAEEGTNKTIIPSEWVFYGRAEDGTSVYSNDDGTGLRDIRDARLKNHLMISYAHIPYLTSSKYLLEEGLVGQQEVVGVASGTSVEQFMMNVDKADTGMIVNVYAPNGSLISGGDAITSGTTIWSKSANGKDSVNYIISSLGDLDNNCSLSSNTYTITKNGSSGNVSGLSLGISLETIMNNVEYPSNATFMFTDGAGQNLPTYKFSNDTNAIKNLEMSAVLASPQVYIEVIAQDGETKCVYSLSFNDDTKPYVISNVYKVLEDEKIIDFVYLTSPATLLNNLIPSIGATAKVVNKLGQERKLGVISYTDRVLVTKGDAQVTYMLNFTTEDGVVTKLQHPAQRTADVYPNPTTDFITIRGFSHIDVIKISDVSGKAISIVKPKEAEPKIDLRKLSPGIYIISVNSDHEGQSFKVLKE